MTTPENSRELYTDQTLVTGESGHSKMQDALPSLAEDDDVVGHLRSPGLMEKTTIHQQILTRGIDGELQGQERACFEALMTTDSAFSDDARALRRLSADIRASIPAEMPVPNAEAFNRSIMERIATIPRD